MTAEQLNQLINIFALITAFEMGVAIGLGVTWTDVLRVATDWRLVGKAAAASYVCVPAAAVGLLVLFRSDPYVVAGLLIPAVCPGASYAPPFTAMAKGNVAVAVGLMVVLAGSSALIAPLLLQWLLPLVLQLVPAGSADGPPLTIDAGQVVVMLLVAQFLPLCIGLALRHWRPALAQRLIRPGNLVSVVLNLTTLVLIIYAQFDMLVGIPLLAFGGMLALIFAGAAAGWLLGGSVGQTFLSAPAGTAGKNACPTNRSAMVMTTGVRNVGVSLVIVTAAFAGTPAVAAATAFALFQTGVMALVALVWGRVASGTANAPAMQKSSGRQDCHRSRLVKRDGFGTFGYW